MGGPGVITIATVLWVGDFRKRDYTLADVERMRRMVDRHCSEPHRFVCLTNDPRTMAALGGLRPGADAIPLAYPDMLPGWWAKLELFRSGLFEGRVLYLDLDVIPVADLAQVAHWRDDAICFAHPVRVGNYGRRAVAMFGKDRGKTTVTRFQSSVIAWNANELTLDFHDLDFYKETVKKYRGDQDYFGDIFEDRAITFPPVWCDKIKFCYAHGPRAETRFVLGNPKDLWRRSFKECRWVRMVIDGYAPIEEGMVCQGGVNRNAPTPRPAPPPPSKPWRVKC